MPKLKLRKIKRSARKAKLRSQWQSNIEEHVIALAPAPGKSRRLAAASASGPIFLFDNESGQVDHSLPGHGFGTMALAWHPNGLTLASCGQDGKARLWDAASGTQIGEVDGGTSWVENVTWLPAKGNRRPPLLATSAGRILRIWNEQGELLHEFTDHSSTITDMQWHTARNELALTSYGVLTIRNPDQPDAVRKLTWQGSSLVVDWSPDGKHVATGDQDATVHFWIMKTGNDLQMSGYATKVRELSWDHTSRYLATGGSDTVIVWDCGGKGPEGSTPIVLTGHEDLLNVLAYQHKGPLLASAGHDGLVMLWAPKEQTEELAYLACPAPISQMAWLPNDQRIAVGADDGTVELITVVI
ncbi:MAG: WD40 repeat domain-containing protein [Chloroflexota bacterium]